MPVEVSGESVWRRSRITVAIPSPAAGADWSFAIPSGHVYRLLSVYAQLVTSAAVATRVARLAFTDGDRTFLDVPPFATQAASLTRRYAWAVSPAATAQGTGILSSLPEVELQAGWTIASVTDLIDVADQWSGIVLNVIDTTVRGGVRDLSAIPDLLVEVLPAGPNG